MTRRRALIALAAVVVVGSSIAALKGLGQFEQVLDRAAHASPWLLALGTVLEALSFAGYVVLLHAVFRPVASSLSWKRSVEITLAGVAATRLLATGGAGGIALTIWALRADDLDTQTAGRRLGALLAVLYAFFFGALAVAGAGLATGLLDGRAPRGLAIGGAGLSVVVGLAAVVAALARAPRFVSDALRLALSIVRERRSAVPAALAWWAFDVAVLWSAFRMYGTPPPTSVLVLCYFLGQVAQTIPSPGGIGPVEGGMIAAFAACGVPVALAVLAVVTYRVISSWLPAASGLWAYLRLRQADRGSGPRRKASAEALDVVGELPLEPRPPGRVAVAIAGSAGPALPSSSRAWTPAVVSGSAVVRIEEVDDASHEHDESPDESNGGDHRADDDGCDGEHGVSAAPAPRSGPRPG